MENTREARVKKRATQPLKNIYDYYCKYNFDEKIKKHSIIIKKIIDEPVKNYIDFKTRLELNGPDAEFPEFEGVVCYLIKALFQNEEIFCFFNRIEYKVLLDQMVNKLICLNIENRFYYPYRTTIYCIESLLELIDFYYRTKDLQEIKNSEQHITKPINEKIGPYYHIFRYRSYMTTFTDSNEYGIPNNIIFPTCHNISATNLIKLRCVPILMMGISNKPVYVDQYINTPLDFWAHDIQHSKRQIQETLRYYDCFIKHNEYYQRRTLFDIKKPLDFYKYMEEYTKCVILPLITHLESDTEEVKAQKDIFRLIIFEVVHEKAWVITHKSLCRNIPLRYDEFPVENLTFDNEKNKITTFHYLFADPTTIGNVVGKIRTGFYDEAKDPNEKIIKTKYRTSEFVAKCAKELVSLLSCKNNPSEEYFLALATDRHSMQEYKDISSIEMPDIPTHSVNYPNEPHNLFDDSILDVKFKPKVSIENEEEQEKLHYYDEVIGYDNSFEKLNKKYLKYKIKYLNVKKTKNKK